MKRRSFFFVLVMVFCIFLFTSSVSLAAEISSIVFNDGSDKEITDFRKTYISNKNIINITVEFDYENEDDAEVSTVKIGSIEEYPGYADEVTFEDFELGSGVNSLTVELIDEDGKSVKQNIKIDYSGSFLVSGSEYKGDISSDAGLSVFKDDITLNFTKGNYVVDASGETIENNIVLFKVYKSDNSDQSLKFSQPLSNWVGIYSDDDEGDNFVYPGTISLKYTQDSIELSPSLITILFQQEGTSEWKNIGAVVDSKKKTATATFQGFGKYGVFLRSRNFVDFNWSRPFAEALWAKGIMKTRNAVGDVIADSQSGEVYLGLTQPSTRSDYASMIVKGLGLTLVAGANTENRFSDLQDRNDIDGDGDIVEDHPCKQEILTAAAYGIMEGRTDGTFDPDGDLTREQAAVVVARVSNLTLILDNDKVDTELKRIFKDTADYDLISEWARPYVLACVKAKIIVGSGTPIKYNAQDPLTRDAAAKFVYNIMKEKKLI
ncbi:MAG: S-layer homology domain-containing protein [Dehalobacterium sp.]